jgi:hypothetical protein
MARLTKMQDESMTEDGHTDTSEDEDEFYDNESDISEDED